MQSLLNCFLKERNDFSIPNLLQLLCHGGLLWSWEVPPRVYLAIRRQLLTLHLATWARRMGAGGLWHFARVKYMLKAGIFLYSLLSSQYTVHSTASVCDRGEYPVASEPSCQESGVRTVYSVHCTVYTVHCTQYTVHRTLYTVHCTLKCTQYRIYCRLYKVKFSMYNVEYSTEYTVQSTLLTVWHTEYDIHYS